MALLSRCLQCKRWVHTCGLTSLFDNFNISKIWHFVLCWKGKTLEWPVPYNTDKSQIWLFGIGNLPWRYYLDDYNAQWVKTCGLTSLFGNLNKSKLTLCSVLSRWNLRVASILQSRQRSNFIVWHCPLKTVLVENLVIKQSCKDQQA